MPDDPTTTTGRISPFERIKHTDADGEFWSARELAKLLDYSRWQKFTDVIKKAEEACKNSGQPVEDHMHHMVHMVQLGSGSQRAVDDVHLSRYACYLIVQNADPSKEIVALGQTYFAVRTRRDELAEDREEARLRIEERDKLKRYHRELFKAARDAGVITPDDFAVFEDHGYRGLYNGETAQDIAARKGLKPNQNIADYMGSTETAANGFRAALAREMLRSDGIQGKSDANHTHHKAGHIVRKAMEDAGVPPPEQLATPAKSIQQLRREEARRQHIEEQDRLGLFAQLNGPTADTETGEER
ncbi:MAG: DNA-damage-inducible protein D [Ktedonobacterales bacterium]|jgi:DNA-damage-inducible protein D|nr:MAG: DNA-damage-inducible protein D [Ktedonobacterales bacterium]